MATIDDYRDRLLDIARETSDVELALVATGYRSASDYLNRLTDPKKTEVGWAKVSGLSKYRLRTIIKANARRREQLYLWIRREKKELEEGAGGNEFYLDLYQKELDLLDTYALVAIADIITNGEELLEEAYENIADRAYNKAVAGRKKSEKASSTN